MVQDVALLKNIFYLCMKTIALFEQNPLPDFSGGGFWGLNH